MKVKTPQGVFEIDFRHEPNYLPTKDAYEGNLIGRVRGKTECLLFWPTDCQSPANDGPSVGVGKALCSIQDQFSKEVGRKVSLTKALRFLPKGTRTLIWKAYFERS